MIEVLFKSEELLIAADSESKVIYGNTSKSSAEVVVKTAKSSMVKTAEDALRIAEVQRELDNALREWDII